MVGKSTNSTFITLVSKEDYSKRVRDFKPKILAKVLANRSGQVISSTISGVECLCGGVGRF